jgi:hypothetical protein
VKFKYFFPLWVFLWLSLLCVIVYYDGGVSWWFPQPIKTTGPVRVVEDDYLFHKTIEYQNGERIEFQLCSPVPALDAKGEIVIVKYRDRWDNFNRCEAVESVRTQPTRASKDGDAE